MPGYGCNTGLAKALRQRMRVSASFGLTHIVEMVDKLFVWRRKRTSLLGQSVPAHESSATAPDTPRPERTGSADSARRSGWRQRLALRSSVTAFPQCWNPDVQDSIIHLTRRPSTTYLIKVVNLLQILHLHGATCVELRTRARYKQPKV